MILNGQIPTTLTALTSSLSFKSSGLRSCFGRTWTRGSHRWRAGQEAGDGRRRAAAAAPTATFLWWLGLRGGKQDLPWRGLDILDSLDIYSHCHISNHISDIYSVYIYTVFISGCIQSVSFVLACFGITFQTDTPLQKKIHQHISNNNPPKQGPPSWKQRKHCSTNFANEFPPSPPPGSPRVPGSSAIPRVAVAGLLANWACGPHASRWWSGEWSKRTHGRSFNGDVASDHVTHWSRLKDFWSKSTIQH